MKNTTNYYKASTTPRVDIESLTYPGQDPDFRNYKFGFEDYFESMPILNDNSEFLQIDTERSKRVMQALALKLQREPWLKEHIPAAGKFKRTILGLETPQRISVPNPMGPTGDVYEVDDVKEGAEIILAQWGDGYSSPVHGHAAGYIHEEILYGKMKVNNYRLVPGQDKVRLTGTQIITRGTFVSMYAPNVKHQRFERQNLIHNFTSIGDSASLHFLPEHTRDGRDNRFEVEYFDDTYDTSTSVVPIHSLEGIYAQKGDVILVRSSNVPDLGDHYILITGHPIMKPWGLRPQEISFDAPNNRILANHPANEKLVLLKLNCEAKMAFHEFHGIKFNNGQITIG